MCANEKNNDHQMSFIKYSEGYFTEIVKSTVPRTPTERSHQENQAIKQRSKTGKNSRGK